MRILTRFSVAALVAAALWLPASAQAQPAPSTLNVTKIVEGDVPPGTTFEIEVVCDSGLVSQGSEPEGVFTTETLTFTEEGGTQSVEIFEFQPVCSVTEIERGGADSVTYTQGDGGEFCEFSSTEVDAVVDFGESSECGVIVTNTYEAEPTPPPAPAPAPAPAVATQPTFTG